MLTALTSLTCACPVQVQPPGHWPKVSPSKSKLGSVHAGGMVGGGSGGAGGFGGGAEQP